MLFVVVSGLTGSAIAFWRDIDAWLNPQWYQVKPDAHRLSLTQLASKAVAGNPDKKIHGMLLPGHPDASLIVLLAADSLGMDEMFLDPYTGAVLGLRDTDAVSLDRTNLLPFLYRVHYSLHLGGFGEYLLGIVALLWLLITFVGLWLAWPKRGKWRKVLSVKGSAGIPRLMFDLHRAGGLLFGGLFVIITWTGLWWNMDYAVQPAVSKLLTTSPLFPETLTNTAPVARPIGPQAALTAASAARPTAEPYYLRPLVNKGLYSVAMRQPDNIDIYGRTTVYVTMADGAIAHISEPDNNKPGDTYRQWQMPLHTGQFLGLPGRLLWLLAGLIPVLFAVTGTALWVRRSRLKRSRKELV